MVLNTFILPHSKFPWITYSECEIRHSLIIFSLKELLFSMVVTLLSQTRKRFLLSYRDFLLFAYVHISRMAQIRPVTITSLQLLRSKDNSGSNRSSVAFIIHYLGLESPKKVQNNSNRERRNLQRKNWRRRHLM